MRHRAHPQQWSSTPERRRKTRIQGAIPARVCGVDTRGRSFDHLATLDNLSACGLHVRLNCRASVGAPLEASFRLPAGPGASEGGTLWETKGVVRRVEARPDGTLGMGVEFTSYQEM